MNYNPFIFSTLFEYPVILWFLLLLLTDKLFQSYTRLNFQYNFNEYFVFFSPSTNLTEYVISTYTFLVTPCNYLSLWRATYILKKCLFFFGGCCGLGDGRFPMWPPLSNNSIRCDTIMVVSHSCIWWQEISSWGSVSHIIWLFRFSAFHVCVHFRMLLLY